MTIIFSVTVRLLKFICKISISRHRNRIYSNVTEKLNIHQSEIIAVGNAANDLIMVQYAGLGVCVNNSEEELREFVDVIVASNNDYGVDEVVLRFVLN